ncbi:MAG: WG repeat-containing protein [Flavobacteriales bacterium]
MKKYLLIFLAASVTHVYGQYTVQKPLKDHNAPAWTLVRTGAGTWGCIDKDGKEVVKPIYKKIDRFGRYHSNWAMVKGITGFYGFIDNSGKEVVPLIYGKIYAFGSPEKELAIVQSVSGFYGIIDGSGKEVVLTVYEKEFLHSNYKALLEKRAD